VNSGEKFSMTLSLREGASSLLAFPKAIFKSSLVNSVQ
jgi:hypothetical protein